MKKFLIVLSVIVLFVIILFGAMLLFKMNAESNRPDPVTVTTLYDYPSGDSDKTLKHSYNYYDTYTYRTTTTAKCLRAASPPTSPTLKRCATFAAPMGRSSPS